ncbi:MAG: hypothetical protein WBC44_02840 [Planctomycetaceae bacterium]
MHTFTDTAGRAWSVVINVDAIRRVRARLDVNLLDAIEGRLLERLVGDPVLLCDVLFVLVEPEAIAKQVTDEEFGRSLGGDVLEAATTALLEELVDFFPSGRRAVFRKALDKLQALEQMALATANERLDSDELERQMAAALASTPGSSSGNSPASSASPPDP